MLSNITNTLYPKLHLNHTVNIQKGLVLLRVVGEKIFQQHLKGKLQEFNWCQGLQLHLVVWAS